VGGWVRVVQKIESRVWKNGRVIELDDEMRGHLEAVVDDLVNTTDGAVTRDHLSDLVIDSFDAVAKNATIAQFLPILAGRYAETQLRAEDLASGRLLKDKPEVLILCEQNRGRSQAAAALMRFYAPGELQVESAGSDPGRTPSARVIAFLRENGVQLTDYPKPFTDQMVRVADHLVVIGDLSRSLPPILNQNRIFWDIPDMEEAELPEIAESMQLVDSDVRNVVTDWLPDLELPEPVVG
jgi:arsenate reductase